MRRSLHGLLVGVFTLWIPLDSAVAGWWLHHHPHHAAPVVWGPAPPCGGPPPAWGPGWAGAVVIDDRPLFAPQGVWVVDGPVVIDAVPVSEWVVTQSHDAVVTEEWVVVDTSIELQEARDCACDPCGGEVIVAESVFGEGGHVEAATVVDSIPIDDQTPGTRWTSDIPVVPTPHGEDRPEATAEPAAPLELPDASTTTAADTTAAPDSPSPAASSSVLEPWEPQTVQGDAAEEADSAPAADTHAGLPDDDDAAAFETPAPEEPIDETPAEPAGQRRRNLFDEVPADEPDAFEAPRGGDEAPPADAFGPADDSGFEAPMDEAPIDEAPMGDEPADDGFEPPVEEVMEEAPADEPAVEKPATDEAPAEADPFDSSLHTPDQPSRRWRDDTGRYSTAGRLVEVRPDSVRILKETGRYTTVPRSRLSAVDAEHVAGITLAARRAADRAGDTAGL